MGRNSDWEEDSDDLRLEELEVGVEMDDEEGWLGVRCLIERCRKSHIVCGLYAVRPLYTDRTCPKGGYL